MKKTKLLTLSLTLLIAGGTFITVIAKEKPINKPNEVIRMSASSIDPPMP